MLHYIRLSRFATNKHSDLLDQWKGINRKQSTRWQHLSRLKARVFLSLQKKISCYETLELILGTGNAIWWVTEPHSYVMKKMTCCEYGPRFCPARLNMH